MHLFVDPGIRDVASTSQLLELDPSSCTLVAGLETLRGPSDLRALVDRAGADRVLFSLDLDDGLARMAAPADAWAARQPDELARRAIDLGVRHLFLLDLSRVGTGRGPGTEVLMKTVRRDHPHVSLTVGGGISAIDEVRSLLSAGATRVLIGSALHDGRIGPSDLARLIVD